MYCCKSVVTLAFHDARCRGHRAGVNAVAADGEFVFTASRDATVRCWRPGSEEAVQTLEGHTDWVNDLATLRPGLLASCSSDRSVRIWTLPVGSQAKSEVLGRHDDYAKALAYAPQARLLVSAGCDCRLMLWDIERFAALGASPAEYHRDSIYDLAVDESGTLIASASVDTTVQLCDPRSPAAAARLSGHADVVRCVRIADSGRHVYSAGSDGTVRVWNVGERRCEQLLRPHARGGGVASGHSDSIFAMSLDGGYAARPAALITASALGEVVRSVLAPAPGDGEQGDVGGGGEEGGGGEAGGAHSCLLARLPRPATALCRGEPLLEAHLGSTSLWVATVDSSVVGYELPPNCEIVEIAEAHRRTVGRPQTEPQEHAAEAGEEAALLGEARVVLRGSAGIRRCATFPSRVHVLTEASDGEVSVWHVPSGSRLSPGEPPRAGCGATSYRGPQPAAVFAAAAASAAAGAAAPLEASDSAGSRFEQVLELVSSEAVSVAPWFTPTCRSGSLELNLEAGACFNAEAYAADLGLDEESSELRVNLGERLLDAAFARWRRAPVEQPPAGAADADGRADGLPSFTLLAPEHVSMQLTEQGICLLSGRASALGPEPPHGTPAWLMHCLVDGTYSPKDSLKLPFTLQPHPGSDLPELPPSASKVRPPSAVLPGAPNSASQHHLPHDERRQTRHCGRYTRRACSASPRSNPLSRASSPT